MKINEFFEKYPKCHAYSNKLFITEIFPNMYADANYFEKILDWTEPEVATRDLEGNLIFIDFVITTKYGKYAIEIDDFQTHGAHISPEQQSKDNLKKDLLRAEYGAKFIVIPKYNIDTEKNRAFDALWRAFIADPDLNRTCGTEIKPHEIQKITLQELKASRDRGEKKGLVCYATGLGKTYLSAFDAKQVNEKTLFLVHRDQILKKSKDAFHDVWPAMSKGFFNAEQKTTDTDIVFASIPTLYREENLSKFSPNDFGYIILDETHHASNENVTYYNILNYFKPKYLLGLTATPHRADDYDILNSVYDGNLIYEISQKEAIEKGYLVPLKFYYMSDNIDYTNIRWQGKKYYEEDLNKLLLVKKRDKKIIDEYKKLKPKPVKTLAFCVSIKHAERMASVFNENGIKANAIHSGNDEFLLSKEQRKNITNQFINDEIELACVVDIFNEGIDIQKIDCLLILRPTESSTIAIQQLGRGLRLATGKNELRVLNFVGKNQRKAFLPYESIFGNPTLDEKGEYEYDNGSKIFFSADLVDIFRQQNALYSQTVDMSKVPKKWIEWGEHIKKEIKDNLYNKINKQNKSIQAQLYSCKIIKQNPKISDQDFKKIISSYLKSKKLPDMKAGLRALTFSKALGFLTGIGIKKTTTKVFDEILNIDPSFENYEKYQHIIENQLQKICFWNSNAWNASDVQNPEAKDFSKLFKNFIFITLYKIILSIGKKTETYEMSLDEWRFFAIFARSYEDYEDITQNILDYKNEKEFYLIERYLNELSKDMDDRFKDLFKLSMVLNYDEANQKIILKKQYIGYVEKVIKNFEKKLTENSVPYPLENGEKAEYEEKLFDPNPMWE